MKLSKTRKLSQMRRLIGTSASGILACGLTLLSVSCLLAADVKRVSAEEAMKAVTFRVQPAYNKIAIDLRLVGIVGIEVVISEDGSVEKAQVMSGNPVLGAMATEAVRKWKFVPFMSDGKAIKVVSELPITFNRLT
jgi:TonB family protein